jgi:hypothetical protein
MIKAGELISAWDIRTQRSCPALVVENHTLNGRMTVVMYSGVAVVDYSAIYSNLKRY